MLVHSSKLKDASIPDSHTEAVHLVSHVVFGGNIVRCSHVGTIKQKLLVQSAKEYVEGQELEHAWEGVRVKASCSRAIVAVGRKPKAEY